MSEHTDDPGARDIATPMAATRPTPESSPGAPEGGEVYCVRCHLTDALHNPPGTISLHAARKDALGHPYPPACDKFTPPATDKETNK